jgi:hypothetical protein
VDKKLYVSDIKDEIKEVIGENKADFNYKTTSILKSLICCLSCRRRSTLRKNARHRNVLYYEKGFERLDKELDIANIINNIRRVKYLMKIFLDKDQRKLLSLRKTKIISSDDEKPISWDFKKQLKKMKLLDTYIEHLRIKKLTKTDYKLLTSAGFENVLTIMA